MPKEISKAWNWKELSSEWRSFWEEPADEVAGLALKWTKSDVKTILDLGCGIGRHALYLASLGFDLTAIDLSVDAVAELDRKSVEAGLDIKTAVGDMIALPYADESFDGLIAYYAIHHTDWNGTLKAVSEIRRVLKSGGKAFVTFLSNRCPDLKEAPGILLDERTIAYSEGFEKGIPHCYISEDDVELAMKGFQIERFRYGEAISKKGRGYHFYVWAQKN